MTALAGLTAVDWVVGRLDMVAGLDAGIGPIKQRGRGLTGGQLLLGMAAAQLVGQDCLAGLDRVRADAGSVLLAEAPVAPSTTAASLAGRFGPAQLAGIETGLEGIYTRWLTSTPAQVRAPLVLRNPTIDLDASDIEVFSRTKQQVGCTYAGMRAGRVHLASWAQAELPLAAELIAGNDSVRPDAGNLLRPALAVLPAQVCGRPRVRADAGYFDAALATKAVELGCDFAIAAKRNTAARRALSAVPDSDWRPARGMRDAQIAACDYAPAGWPPGTYTIIRRVKIGVEQPAPTHDPAGGAPSPKTSSRWRWAAPPTTSGQSALVINIPADAGDYVGLEAWSATGPASRNASARPSTAAA